MNLEGFEVDAVYYMRLYDIAVKLRDRKALMLLKKMHKAGLISDRSRINEVLQMMLSLKDVRGFMSTLDFAVSIELSDIGPYWKHLAPKLIEVVKRDHQPDHNDEVKRIKILSYKINHDIFDKYQALLPSERLYMSLCLLLSSPTLSPLITGSELVPVLVALRDKAPDLLRILWNDVDLVSLPAIAQEPQVVQVFAQATLNCFKKKTTRKVIEEFFESANDLLSAEEVETWQAWFREKLAEEELPVPAIFQEKSQIEQGEEVKEEKKKAIMPEEN